METFPERGAGLRGLQARAFVLTWLSYASYYLTRKNISVVKSRLNADLGVSVGWLGVIDTTYLVLYALGQFVNGAAGDRLGARRMIGIGMIATAIASIAFGASSSAWVFAIAFGFNGLAQSTGWSNNVKAIGPWIPRRVRGFVMGLWCTNYQVGGLVATALATFLLVRHGWRSAFFVPAAWVSGLGAIILTFLVETPRQRGLPPIDPSEASAALPGESPSAFREIVRLPALWMIGGAYFGLKLIRYSLLFWLPFFLHKELGYDEGTAGYVSTAFEGGGIVGAIFIGGIADRFFPRNPMRFVVPILLGLAGSFLVLRLVGHAGVPVMVGTLALIGFLLFGPDALLSGAVAQNVGGERATASAAGFINGLGSTGAALQGVLTATVSQAFGWNALFGCFLGFAILAALSVTPLAIRNRF